MNDLPPPVTTPSSPAPYRGPLDPNGPIWPLVLAILQRFIPKTAIGQHLLTLLAGMGLTGAAVVKIDEPAPAPAIVAPAPAPELEGNRIRRERELAAAVAEARRDEHKKTREQMLATLDYADQTMPIGKFTEYMRYQFEPEPGEFPKEPVP